MSLNTDLSKLNKLIKRANEKRFDLNHYGDFVKLVESIKEQSQVDLFTQAKHRSELISSLIKIVGELTVYAETNQMPEDKYNKGLFRLCILKIDSRGDDILLVSKSTFGDKEITPGVYHWQCPLAYGYNEGDIVSELTIEYIEKLDLTNEQIKEVLKKADEILKNNALVPATSKDKNKKYMERWPNTEDFVSCGLKIKDLDEFGKLDIDQLSAEFDIEIDDVDFEGCNLHVFGPNNNVQMLVNRLATIASITNFSSGDLEFVRNW